jgi:hypothetical protein
MRTLGGSIGLAAGVIVFNLNIRSSTVLTKILTSSQLAAIYKSPIALEQLPEGEQQLVAKTYSSAFTSEMRVATYMAAVCLVASLLTLQRNAPFKGPPGSGKSKKSNDSQQMVDKTSLDKLEGGRD